MTRDQFLAISREPNVAAVLRVIRACEGTAADDGYRTLFGYERFDSFADHPRRLVTKGSYSSTAAGAYQIIERTWDGLVRQHGFTDFTPATQDAAAVALIAGRGALDDVRAGRLEDAIAKLAPEWASLPGAPYGQPTRSMEFVRKVYAMHRTPPQPVTRPEPAPKPAGTPMAPLIPALLGVLASIAPELVRIIGDKSKPVADRNVEIGMKVLEVAQQVAQAPGPAAAVEQIAADPALQQQFRAAVREQWYAIEEAGGGGIEGAREQAARMTEGDGWRAIGYGVTLAALSLMIVAGGGALVWTMLMSPDTTGEQRGMLLGAVVALISAVVSYWFGSSVSSRAKDNALVSERGKR